MDHRSSFSGSFVPIVSSNLFVELGLFGWTIEKRSPPRGQVIKQHVLHGDKGSHKKTLKRSGTVKPCKLDAILYLRSNPIARRTPYRIECGELLLYQALSLVGLLSNSAPWRRDATDNKQHGFSLLYASKVFQDERNGRSICTFNWRLGIVLRGRESC